LKDTDDHDGRALFFRDKATRLPGVVTFVARHRLEGNLQRRPPHRCPSLDGQQHASDRERAEHAGHEQLPVLDEEAPYRERGKRGQSGNKKKGRRIGPQNADDTSEQQSASWQCDGHTHATADCKKQCAAVDTKSRRHEILEVLLKKELRGFVSS
jgi:hypothetical protein